jgi:hypothetical protein
MKAAYLFLVVFFSSCCLGNRKCNESDLSVSFRLLNAVNGEDLIFGANSVYDKNSIKFYSLTGNDTLFHSYQAAAYSNNPQDSFLFVVFDYRKIETVYVMLASSDVDTLNVIYETNTSQCCQDYSTINLLRYNNTILQASSSGITTIKK